MRKDWCRFISITFMFAILAGCASHSPAPVSSLSKSSSGKYSQVERGSYRGSFYEVSKGDTLYFIAYLTDKDVKDIIRYNGLKAPYVIHPGQKLKLWQPAYSAPSYGGTGVSVAAASTTAPAASGTTAPKKSPPPAAKTSTASTAKTSTKKVETSKPKEYVKPTSKQNVNKTVSKPTSSNDKVSKWLWPTKGRVIKGFSTGDQGNKGIDIAGQRGQSVIATAKGTVVYSGNALRGYGNLIIVKHNENYLSAYAHNDKLLVSEGSKVSAGQQIATMGSSGTNSVRLHFEIRYKGKSVNPKRYLP
ncbi:peptidoglycan DD-metalloendopeptidase family protein [Vibrio maerlii]|uniref:peptidoglycan DD-metalloendopeptidase family protein n=1 Tax=Vibrio maerlii TaxID=2231648 RepID=UPI000E3CB055|nr:peptidoglycan DD-metalloendopeptidase family protein [Vibrio maerlii]